MSGYSHQYYQEHREQMKVNQRRWALKHQEEFNRYQRAYKRQHQLGTSNGIIFGLNKRPYVGYCEICGRENTRFHYHHWDGDNPSKGVWLCLTCHRIAEITDIGDITERVAKYLEIKSQIDMETR